MVGLLLGLAKMRTGTWPEFSSIYLIYLRSSFGQAKSYERKNPYHNATFTHFKLTTRNYINPLCKYSRTAQPRFFLGETHAHTVRPSSCCPLLPVHCWQTGSRHWAPAPQPSGCQDDDTSSVASRWHSPPFHALPFYRTSLLHFNIFSAHALSLFCFLHSVGSFALFISLNQLDNPPFATLLLFSPASAGSCIWIPQSCQYSVHPAFTLCCI